MAKIIFSVNPKKTIESIIGDLRSIMVTRDRFKPFQKDNGTWVIDASNDYFLHIRATNHYDFTHRYDNKEFLSAVAYLLSRLSDYDYVKVEIE